MRLAAQAKGGFYPCPPEVIALYVQKLKGEGITLLDPCCGKGEALKQLAQALNAEKVFGIEVESGRAGIAREYVPTVLYADYLSSQISSGCFSLVWLNPPYDDEVGGGRRVEYTFLMRATTHLAPGGILAFVIPERIANQEAMQTYLAQHYRNLSLVRFPDEHRRFGECIITGIKRTHAVLTKEPWFKVCLDCEDLSEVPVYEVPQAPGPKRFAKGGFTEEELAQALMKSPLARITAPAPVPEMACPPLPLTNGHISLLLASGHLDGVVAPPGEEPHVVRGTARKVKYISESSEDENGHARTVYSERIVLTVRTATQGGKLTTLANDGGITNGE